MAGHVRVAKSGMFKGNDRLAKGDILPRDFWDKGTLDLLLSTGALEAVVEPDAAPEITTDTAVEPVKGAKGKGE